MSFTIKNYENSWSIIQVLEHLVLVDQKCFQSIQETAHKRKKSSISSKFNSILLNSVLVLPTRYKAPKTKHIKPISNLSIRELLIKWSKSKQSWINLLEQFSFDELKLTVFKHPYVGLLTIDQTLLFIAYHIKHHHYQINRIIFNLNKK